MFSHFFFFLKNSSKLIFEILTRYPDHQRLTLKQIGVLLFFLPLLLAIQVIHWLGFFLDEIFFRGYRKIIIKQPVFIISIPRSGTTFLHRTLTADHRFATMQTWECLFAPSISERKIFLLLFKLDNRTGKFISNLFKRIDERFHSKFDDIHAVRFNSPEEDYLTLLPILSSFVLALPLPMADFLWDMGKFDQNITMEKQKIILDFYKKMLQKHLYIHGQDKIILSKNASFPSLVPSLLTIFPDCKIICPTRTVDQAFRSQLSSITGAIRFFGNEHLATLLRDKFADLFIHYCQILKNTLQKTDNNRYIIISMHDLQTKLSETISNIYCHFSMDMDSITEKKFTYLDEKTSNYVSNHKYDLQMFQLDNWEKKKIFQDILEKGYFSKKHS